MQKYIQSISILLILQLAICSDDLTPNQMLEKSVNRLDNIDYRMILNGKTTEGKKVKKGNFEICIHWDINEEKYKMIYIKELVEEGDKGRKMWVHFHRDKKNHKWTMLPRSGKIKNITDKKSSQKIDLSSISFPVGILKNEMVFRDDETVNDVLCKVIEIKDEDGDIRFWVDPIDFIIHKKEYYNKKSEISKEVTYSNLTVYGDLKFYQNERIFNTRKESTVEISLEEFEEVTFENLNKFNIPLKK